MRQGRHPYLRFSVGHRVCIGDKEGVWRHLQGLGVGDPAEAQRHPDAYVEILGLELLVALEVVALQAASLTRQVLGTT